MLRDIIPASQGSGGTIVKNDNGWAKLGNGLVIVWGNGNVWNSHNQVSNGQCHAKLPIKMKSIYTSVGNMSNYFATVNGFWLTSDGLYLNAWWDSCGYEAWPTAWHYIAIGVPADDV